MAATKHELVSVVRRLSVVVVAVLAAGCNAEAWSSTERTPEGAPVAAVSEQRKEVREFETHAREIWSFTTLEELIVNSIVVEGSVSAVGVDRVLDVGPDSSIRISRANLTVDRVLYGDPPGAVTIEDDGILAARSTLGDRGIYFLVQKRDQEAGIYRLVTSAGRYRVDSAGVLYASNPGNELAASLAKLGLPGLRQAIEDARSRLRTAGMTPRPLP